MLSEGAFFGSSGFCVASETSPCAPAVVSETDFLNSAPKSAVLGSSGFCVVNTAAGRW